MSSLLRSIWQLWENSEELCALVPSERVFTGRGPSTTEYRFPWVSILVTGGASTHRSDKSRLGVSHAMFSIWIDDAKLENGLQIAQAITDAYADRCWPLSETAKVLDVLDQGEPGVHQTDLPNVKAWNVTKQLVFHVERLRVDRSEECCTFESFSSSSLQSSSSETNESSSSESAASTSL
jgi:hypothetical protein